MKIRFDKALAWELANKPVVLFFLSVVALTIIPFQYSSCQEARTNREHMRRLEFELINRMSQWLNYSIDPDIDEIYRRDFPAFASVLLRVPNADDPRVPMFGVFSEFIDRPLISLVGELHAMSKTDAERQSFQDIIISIGSTRINRPGSDAFTPLPLSEAANAFLRGSGLSRWSDRLPARPGLASVSQ